jgi:membrane protease subunit HflK
MDYRGSMLTRDENIVDIELVVQFRRTDPQAFLFNMRDPEEAIEYATASAIREIIGRNLLDFILTDGRAEVARDTQDLLQVTLDSYGAGVTVYEVNLVNANFPSEVEGSVQDSIRAREDRARRILEAESYSNDILPRARGEAARRRQDAEAYRAQVVADSEGEADRFTQILVEYQKAPGVTRERLYIETLEEILRNSTKVLVDTEGGNNLLYLPLDQLVQRRSSAPALEPSTVTVAPSTSSSVPVRGRERETR